MNKAELIDKIASESGQTKKVVAEILERITGTIQTTDKVTLVGFGTFQKKTRAEKKGRNPHTGADLIIPAHTVLAFKASKK